MIVSNKISNFFILLFLVSFMSCNTVPATQIDECIMPDDYETKLLYVTSNLQNKVVENNPVDLEDEVDLPRVCVIPEQIKESERAGHELEVKANLIDFSLEQEDKMKTALERLRLVVNSVEFKERILAHTYSGNKQFVDNDGLSNQEIYLKIMEGAETLSRNGDGGNIADGEIDLDIELYYSSKNVVGYTYPNVLQIWVNTKYFTTNSLGAVAANVIHEWTHKLGFEHSYNNNSSRPYSVPYAVGTIMKDLVNSM